jgi:dolichol-phosphate mannosyltransferase
VDYSIVTITFNEAENIAEFLRSVAGMVRPLGRNFEIIVVDDNSPDGTGAIVEKTRAEVPEARLVTRYQERGIGSAYLRGLKEARGRIVAAMDADFSHPPAALTAMLAAAEDGLVVGSRFLERSHFDTPWYRFVPTRSINLWHRMLLRTRVHDHTNGYIALPKVTLESLLNEGNRIGIRPFDRILYQLVLITLARRANVNVKEIPAKYVFRTRGETKIHFARGVKLLAEEWVDSLRLARYLWRSSATGKSAAAATDANAA